MMCGSGRHHCTINGNGLDMELGTYRPGLAHISLTVSTCAAHVLGRVKVVRENHQPKLHIGGAIAAS